MNEVQGVDMSYEAEVAEFWSGLSAYPRQHPKCAGSLTHVTRRYAANHAHRVGYGHLIECEGCGGFISICRQDRGSPFDYIAEHTVLRRKQ